MHIITQIAIGMGENHAALFQSGAAIPSLLASFIIYTTIPGTLITKNIVRVARSFTSVHLLVLSCIHREIA
ncbi:hypothetical protein KDK_00670 [Dictyobacter kobayashii]|uniref:Uncharacterized protein n=1 Tax=Dictyobacter kobayashii TaxID=2014872 RepID=A0A402AAT4_9CHLR|nr:hypothetical protein KDK_00670 [Dictyobacter kobayashii]